MLDHVSSNFMFEISTGCYS